MSKLIVAVMAGAFIFSLAQPAQATRRHNHKHHHRHFVSHRHHHFPPNSARFFAPVGDIVANARQYIGQTAGQVGVRSSLWCSAFLRKIDGDKPGVDDSAMSWLTRPHAQAAVGKIVVLRSHRKHVGVVSGFDANGNPIVISGNHLNRVMESVYPKRRVIAYVEP